MTTATRSSLDELEQLAAAHAEAKAELADVNQRRAEYRGKIHGLRERLLGRTIDHGGEFDATGQPKAKSEAAKLAAEITKLIEADNFDSLADAAEARVERARVAERRHVDQDAREMLVELLPEAEAAVAEFKEWASQGAEHIQRLAQLQHRASSLCTQSRTFDPRDIPNLDHWSNAVRAIAAGAPSLPLPRELLAELKAEDD